VGRAATKDPFGTVVVMTDKTWKHITKEHPGMTATTAEVQTIVESPEQIRESQLPFPAFGFEGSTNVGGIRVMIAYDTANLFTAQADAYVSTAYPITPGYSNAVGKVIWTSPKSNTDAKGEEEEKK